MMERLGEMGVWLWRIGHCKGFGIQSPTDYRFVVDVVNGRDAEAYDARLDEAFPSLGRRERKLCRLYRRIAHYAKPRLAVDYRPKNAASTAFISSGWSEATVTNELPDAGEIDLLRIDADEDWEQTFAKALPRMDERSVMIVTAIKRNRKAREQWRCIVRDTRATITFDLYYAGIAFFDHRRYKQHYTVNF